MLRVFLMAPVATLGVLVALALVRACTDEAQEAREVPAWVAPGRR